MLRVGGPDWQRVLSYVESIYRHFEMWRSEVLEANAPTRADPKRRKPRSETRRCSDSGNKDTNSYHPGKELQLYLHALAWVYFQSVAAQIVALHILLLESRYCCHLVRFCSTVFLLGNRTSPFRCFLIRCLNGAYLFPYSIGSNSNTDTPRILHAVSCWLFVKICSASTNCRYTFVHVCVGADAAQVLLDSVGVHKQHCRKVWHASWKEKKPQKYVMQRSRSEKCLRLLALPAASRSSEVSGAGV